jgi:hypothetical protein
MPRPDYHGPFAAGQAAREEARRRVHRRRAEGDAPVYFISPRAKMLAT